MSMINEDVLKRDLEGFADFAVYLGGGDAKEFDELLSGIDWAPDQVSKRCDLGKQYIDDVDALDDEDIALFEFFDTEWRPIARDDVGQIALFLKDKDFMLRIYNNGVSEVACTDSFSFVGTDHHIFDFM